MSSPERIEVRSPVRAGEVVDGKYRITGILGAGGMGVVVSAMQLALDEPVALKFMTAEGKADETARARFLREAKAARKLTSAHVARVFDVGQLRSGEPYIVMELLEGDDLGKHLRLHGRLTTADTVRFMLQVCDAIREAHALGIVHRDLKPQNLFLCRRPGSGPVIKVLDFGIAKSLNVSDSDGSLTASQNVVGSPVYMSPEQLRASKHVDTRTDIWSMGVIMFELLSGKVPFAGDSVLELGMRIMTVPAPSLVELRAEVPAALADVVQRCLEKDPENRYPTIDTLAADLKQFLDTSQPQLPFADTMDGPLGDGDSDHIRTGGEFGRTNRGLSVASGARSTWLRVLIAAAIPVALGSVLLLRRHAAPAVVPTPVAVASVPQTYHAAVSVEPDTARLRVDGEEAQGQPLARDIPLDGRTHLLRVEAPGFEPLEVSFRDAPPPGVLTLKPLPSPMTSAAAVSATEPHAAHPSVRRPPPSTAGTPGASKTSPPVASPPPVPAATATTPPTTTNDSPILR